MILFCWIDSPYLSASDARRSDRLTDRILTRSYYSDWSISTKRENAKVRCASMNRHRPLTHRSCPSITCQWLISLWLSPNLPSRAIIHFRPMLIISPVNDWSDDEVCQICPQGLSIIGAHRVYWRPYLQSDQTMLMARPMGSSRYLSCLHLVFDRQSIKSPGLPMHSHWFNFHFRRR